MSKPSKPPGELPRVESVPGQLPLFEEAPPPAADSLAALVAFCEAVESRFMTIDYAPLGGWTVSIFLGRDYTCDAPFVVRGRDHWLKVSDGAYDVVLMLAVTRLSRVRRKDAKVRAQS